MDNSRPPFLQAFAVVLNLFEEKAWAQAFGWTDDYCTPVQSPPNFWEEGPAVYPISNPGCVDTVYSTCLEGLGPALRVQA